MSAEEARARSSSILSQEFPDAPTTGPDPSRRTSMQLGQVVSSGNAGDLHISQRQSFGDTSAAHEDLGLLAGAHAGRESGWEACSDDEPIQPEPIQPSRFRTNSIGDLDHLKLDSIQLEARTQVEWKSRRFSPDKSLHVTRITGPQELLDKFAEHNLFSPVCKLSPLAHVNLPVSVRVRSHIPEEGSFFAFVYPASFTNEMAQEAQVSEETMHRLDLNDPQISLCLLGGFAYFDESGFPLVVNSIVGAEGKSESRSDHSFESANFAGGLDFKAGGWPLGEVAHRVLREEGRLVDVTFPPLRKLGAQSFGWIHPLEFKGEHLGEMRADFGAFVYTDEEKGGGKGRYFPVSVLSAEADRQELERRVDYAMELMKPPSERMTSPRSPAMKATTTTTTADGVSPAPSSLKGRLYAWTPGSRQSHLTQSSSENVYGAALAIKDRALDTRRVERVMMMVSTVGNVELVQRLLAKQPSLVNAADEEGYTPLIRAAMGGHTKLVEHLLDKGADVCRYVVKSKDAKKKKRTAMTLALRAKNFESALALLEPLFQVAPGRALLDAVEIAGAAGREASHLRNVDPSRSHELRRVSREAELKAAGLLSLLPPAQLRAVLCTELGEQALARAVIGECKQLLGLPELQTWLAREWRGDLFTVVVTGQAEPPWGASVRLSGSRRLCLLALTLLLVVPANLLVLPLVAAVPPIGLAVRTMLSRIGPCCAPRHSAAAKHGYSEYLGVEWEALYLLELPSLKFFSATLLNVALSAALTTLPPPSTPDDDGRTVGSYLSELSAALRGAASSYVGRVVDASLDDGGTNVTATGGVATGDLVFGDAGPSALWHEALLDAPEVAWPALPQVGWQQSASVLLVWLASAVWYALVEFLEHGLMAMRLWSADPLNLLELPSLVLAAASLAVPLAAGVGMGDGGGGGGGGGGVGDDDDDDGAIEPHSLREQSKVLLAAALLLLWSAQTLRLLSMLPDIGPLVLMFFKMLRDVVMWLVLVGALVLAFAASFHTIFKGTKASLDGDCEGLEVEIGSGVSRSIWVLIKQLLGTDPVLDCLEETAYSLMSTGLLGLYLILAVIMLVNMLIAMMAKTFDVVWESQALNYQFVFARTVLSWADKPATPPPLLLLTVPYQAATTVLCAPARVIERLCGRKKERRHSRFRSGRLGDAAPFVPLVDEDGGGESPRGGGGSGGEVAEEPSSPARRASWLDCAWCCLGGGGEAAKEPSTPAPHARGLDDEVRTPRQLKAQVREFVENHMEDDGAEERWRKTQAATLAKLARDQEKALARLEDKLERALKAKSATAPSYGAVSSIPSLAGSLQPSPNTKPSPRSRGSVLHSKATQKAALGSPS